MNRREREAIQLAESEGYTVLAHGYTGKEHQRLHLRHGDGTEFIAIFSCSPSDFRVTQQRRKQLRHQYREAQNRG